MGRVGAEHLFRYCRFNKVSIIPYPKYLCVEVRMRYDTFSTCMKERSYYG